MTGENETARRLRRTPWIAAAALVALAGAAAAVYGMAPAGSNADAAVCADARAAAARVKPLVHGEVAALSVAENPKRLPNLAFTAADGTTKSLEDFRGRTVLVNLWATWCVPCRAEMPALSALQANAGGPTFGVVAVNIDTRDPQKPKAWLRENNIAGLDYYADPSAKVFQDLKGIGKAFGMPTTVLVDPKGCEIASLAGPAEWASEDALKVIRAAVGG